MRNATDQRLGKTGTGLTMLIVGGSLVSASILFIVLLLVLAGFLKAPLLLVITISVAGAVILGLSIAAAVLSRHT